MHICGEKIHGVRITNQEEQALHVMLNGAKLSGHNPNRTLHAF